MSPAADAGITSPVIVGHSMGGILSRTMVSGMTPQDAETILPGISDLPEDNRIVEGELWSDPELADRSLLFNAEHPDPNDPLHTFAVDDGFGYDDGNGFVDDVHGIAFDVNGRRARRREQQLRHRLTSREAISPSTRENVAPSAEVASGRKIQTLYGDTSDPSRPVIRTLNEELSRIAQRRLLNPAWIEGKKRHGYKGAGDISSRTNHMYGWQATTKQVENRVFDGIAETFLLNEENRRFFEENNPWALEEIGRRLLEAERRGLWKADSELMEQLKEIYLEIEGWIEERMEEVDGDFQGAGIDIIKRDKIGKSA